MKKIFILISLLIIFSITAIAGTYCYENSRNTNNSNCYNYNSNSCCSR